MRASITRHLGCNLDFTDRSVRLTRLLLAHLIVFTLALTTTAASSASIELIAPILADGTMGDGRFLWLGGVSADGSTVVGSATRGIGGSFRAFRWRHDTGFTSLPIATDIDGAVLVDAVSGDGTFVAATIYQDDPRQQAIRWSEERGTELLGFSPGGTASRAAVISRDGSTILGWEGLAEGGGLPFVWTRAEGMRRLEYFPGWAVGLPSGISDDGTVISGHGSMDSQGEDGHDAFRWTPETGSVLLGIPGESIATAVSADGRTIVGHRSAGLGYAAFRWNESEGMVPLPVRAIDGIESAHVHAFGVSADGGTIVGRRTTASGMRATLWTRSEGAQDLAVLLAAAGVQLDGWRLSEALGVSDDGLTIVGYANNAENDLRIFVAVIPEPSTALLIALGLAKLAWRRTPDLVEPMARMRR